MNPGEQLIKSIDKRLHYSLTDLVEKAQNVGILFTKRKLQHAILANKLKYTQPGGKHCDYHIQGIDFLDYFFSEHLPILPNLPNVREDENA
jgi:hypothetical protein